MDFFESQDTARRNTGRLILLFGLAIASLVVITNLLVMALFGFSATQTAGPGAAPTSPLGAFDWGTFLTVSAIVVTVILLGSLYKVNALSGGGARVAEMMKARLLLPGSGDFYERRALNVVEEMAIASGTPVPPLYIMEEPGINAFAAGYAPGDAVVAVTRGAITELSREQLQGVIAHEFSHILHGDMRINIRLIGVLHGILILGIIGYHLLRGGAYSGAYGRRSKNSGGILALGLGLIIIGYVGTFFGNLIKAAVSRQREFLADASAVQFTRNPEGIGGALMRIARHEQRSYLNNPGSAEISHALFEEGRYSPLRSLYATHPPLEKRIAAILPNWQGDYELLERSPPQRPGETPEGMESTGEEPAGAAAGTGSQARERMLEILGGGAAVILGGAAIDQAGMPTPQHLAYAEALREAIPEPLLEAVHNPSAARAVIYLLLLDEDAEVRARQLTFLEDSADRGVHEELQQLLATELTVNPALRLPLVEIALGTLRQLSAPQYKLFRDNFNKLIAMDEKISLFEWSLQKIVFQQLDTVFGLSKPARLGRKELAKQEDSVARLLAVLVYATAQKEISAEEAFARGAAELDMSLTLPARDTINYGKLSEAMARLQQVKALQKPRLLKACAASITADGQVTIAEAEVFRAIAAILDCPMPPLEV